MDDDHAHDDHSGDDHHAHDESTVAIGVLTVSSSRTLSNDPGGDVIAAVCEDAGHEISDRRLVGDDREAITEALVSMIDDEIDVVVTTGGTGLTPDDVTPETAAALFDRPIPGFGELFRWLSYEEVGPMAMASRATAGVAEETLVFCLPGSENAARLGAAELVAPTVEHLVGLIRR